MQGDIERDLISAEGDARFGGDGRTVAVQFGDRDAFGIEQVVV